MIMSDIMFQVLKANGFKITAPRKDGSRKASAEAYALGSGVTVKFTLTAPAEGPWNLVVTNTTTGRTAGKSGDPAEIASDAVAYAHKVRQS
jgi:hypothetical protein